MPAGGGTSQTAVNRLAGARSQLAGLVTGGATLLTLLFLAPLISLMPQATLAAVVIVYSVGLIQLPEFRAILAVRRTEFIWAVAAFAGVMLLGTLKGILAAIIISLVSLAHQVSDPPVYRLGRKRGTSVFRPLSEEHPDDEIFDGLLILRPVGRLFFANGQRVGEKFRLLVEQAQPRVVVLDLSAVFDVEYTVLKMLAEGEARMKERGISLWLVGLTPEVLTAVRRSPFGKAVGQERMFFNLEQAVAMHLATQGRGSFRSLRRVCPASRRFDVRCGIDGAPGPGLVFVNWGFHLQHRIDDAPRFFDVVHPRKQLGVSVERIAQDAIVGVSVVGARLPAGDELGPLADHLVALIHRRDAERDRLPGDDSKSEIVLQRSRVRETGTRLEAGAGG